MTDFSTRTRPMTLLEKKKGLQVRAAAWQSTLAVGDRARGLVYEVTVAGTGTAIRQSLMAQARALGVEEPIVVVATAGGTAIAVGDGARAVAEEGATAEAAGTRTRAYAIGLATARALGDDADASASGHGDPDAGVAYALANGQSARAHARSRQARQCIAYARTERSVSHATAEGIGSRACAMAERGLTAESSAYDGAFVLAEAGCGHVYLEGRGATTELLADNWTEVPVTMVYDSGNHVWGVDT